MGIRVLHLVTSLGAGGIERWLLDMLKESRATDVQMDFCCRDPHKGISAQLYRANGANILVNPFDFTHIRFGKRLQCIIRDGGYHIVHNHLTILAGFPALVSRLAGVRIISSFHNTDFEWGAMSKGPMLTLRRAYAKLSVPLAIHCSDVITGCSNDVLHRLDSFYKLRGTPKRVLYYGVRLPNPASSNEKRAFRESIGLPAEAKIVTHIGRFVPQKNHEAILEIAQRVTRKHSNAYFVLVGDGPMRSNIQKLIAKKRLSSHFRVLGIRHDVERILVCSDLFLFPSRWEGFGLVALEANAAGLPVVASNISGIREAVRNEETAILCPVNDLDNFASWILRFLVDTELRLKFGEQSIEYVKQNFLRSHSAERLFALYSELSN